MLLKWFKLNWLIKYYHSCYFISLVINLMLQLHYIPTPGLLLSRSTVKEFIDWCQGYRQHIHRYSIKLIKNKQEI